MAECQGPQRRGFDAKTTIPSSPELSNRWCRGWDNFGGAPGAVVGRGRGTLGATGHAVAVTPLPPPPRAVAAY